MEYSRIIYSSAVLGNSRSHLLASLNPDHEPRYPSSHPHHPNPPLGYKWQMRTKKPSLKLDELLVKKGYLIKIYPRDTFLI